MRCACRPNMLSMDCPIHRDEATALVTEAIENDALISRTPDYECDLCGKQAETRPHGPNGEEVCFECGMKDEEAAKRAFGARIGVPASSPQQPPPAQAEQQEPGR